MSGRPATVLFVEDTIALLDALTRILEQRGLRVLATAEADEALAFIEREEHIDVAVLDIELPLKRSKRLDPLTTLGGRWAGVALAEAVRRRFRSAPIVFWTARYERELRARLYEIGNSRIYPKTAGIEPVTDHVMDCVTGFRSGTRPRSFLVHGHDESTMKAVRRYLMTTLRFPEPVVLRDMESVGRTVIEKLEGTAHDVDLVFVVLTPDDQVVDLESPGQAVFRSRQNVIFELGYFLGLLGRGSGRVILLYRRPLELPSDIGGMIAIDITDGLESAHREIIQEVREWI